MHIMHIVCDDLMLQELHKRKFVGLKAGADLGLLAVQVYELYKFILA